jgi:hypothetical protein
MNKYLRDVHKLIRNSGLPFVLSKRNKHRRLMLNGKTLVTFNSHHDGSNDLHDIAHVIRQQRNSINEQ